jgi:hypothetical protein
MESANTALAVRTGPGDDEPPVAVQTELQVDLADTRERLGIPDPDTPFTINPSPGVAELEHLKEAIREQEQAKLGAFEAAAELQQQLAAAQAAVARSKTQYHGAPKSRGAMTRAETELAEASTRLHATKKELDWEQRSRRTEAIQASTKIQRLERELAEAVAASSGTPSKSRRVPLQIAVGVAVALALAAGIAAIAMHGGIRVATASANTNQLQPDHPQEEVAAVASRHSGPSAAPDFTQSVDRLSQALAALPGHDPEEVLRQVQQAGKGCALRWNAGEPSLLFGGLGTKSSSFGAVMTQCAEAVEKLH